MSTTAMAVAALRVAYPRQEFPDESVRLYVRMLDDLDPTMVGRATERLIRRSTFLPSVAEIRLEVAEESYALPTATEAWSMVSDRGLYPLEGELPGTVRDSLRAVGGLWAIKSTSGYAVRAQFLRDYEQRRATAMLEATGARAPRQELTRAEQAFGTLDAIPEVDEGVMRPRPVYARWLRRMSGNPGVPTDEEKHDAIEVLASTWDDDAEFGSGLHTEAQRIMDEASA